MAMGRLAEPAAGIIDMVGGAALLAMAAAAYQTASRGMGIPSRGYGAAGAPEEKFIGVRAPLRVGLPSRGNASSLAQSMESAGRKSRLVAAPREDSSEVRLASWR